MREAKAGEKTVMDSAPFYTENHGYKLKAVIYLDGYHDGEHNGKFLSLFIRVMRGKYDAILPWPFKRIVKFTLIDQQEDPDERENVIREILPGNDPDCFAMPKKRENFGRGIPIISHTKLQSRRYVVDETLFIPVEVGSESELYFSKTFNLIHLTQQQSEPS